MPCCPDISLNRPMRKFVGETPSGFYSNNPLTAWPLGTVASERRTVTCRTDNWKTPFQSPLKTTVAAASACHGLQTGERRGTLYRYAGTASIESLYCVPCIGLSYRKGAGSANGWGLTAWPIIPFQRPIGISISSSVPYADNLCR